MTSSIKISSNKLIKHIIRYIDSKNSQLENMKDSETRRAYENMVYWSKLTFGLSKQPSWELAEIKAIEPLYGEYQLMKTCTEFLVNRVNMLHKMCVAADNEADKTVTLEYKFAFLLDY